MLSRLLSPAPLLAAAIWCTIPTGIAPAAQPGLSVPGLWKARALEAADNLRRLKKELEAFKSSWQSPAANKVKCQTMLETAYALHIVEPDIAHKITRDGKHVLKVILSGGDQGLFDLSYMYDGSTWELEQVMIQRLPKWWSVTVALSGVPPGRLVAVTISSSEHADSQACMVVFDLTNPFAAEVIVGPN